MVTYTLNKTHRKNSTHINFDTEHKDGVSTNIFIYSKHLIQGYSIPLSIQLDTILFDPLLHAFHVPFYRDHGRLRIEREPLLIIIIIVVLSLAFFTASVRFVTVS